MKYNKHKKQTIASRVFVAMLIIMVTMSFMPRGFFGEAASAAPGKASNQATKTGKATSKDAKNQANQGNKKDTKGDQSGKDGDKANPDKKPDGTPDADGNQKPNDKKDLKKKPEKNRDKKDDSKTLQKKSHSKLRKAGEKIDVVASIGDKEYETLQKAIDEAKAGDTILLKKDQKEAVSIAKGITIDLGGHSLSGTDKIPVTISASNKAVTIKNGSIVGIKSIYISSPAAIKITNTPVNLESISITGCTGPGIAIVDSSYTASGIPSKFTNVTISGNKTQCIWGGSADDMTFTGCHFDNNTPEGTNRLVAVGGIGNHTFDNCTFKNNSAQGIADTDGIYKNCVLTGNTCTDQATISGDKITLINTVVKENKCTEKYGVAGVDAKELVIENSAIYKNTNSADGRTDLGEDCSDIDVTKMKDPTDASMDFAGYTVDDKGTVCIKVPTFEAEINGKKYEKLTDAVEEAKSGDTIKIINTSEAGDIKAVAVNELWIQKKLTVDLNGRDVTSDGWGFCTDEKGDLTLINSADKKASLEGTLYNADKEGKMTVGDNIKVENRIYSNEHTVINGTHDKLSIYNNEDLNGGKSLPFTFGEKFSYTGDDDTLEVTLAENTAFLNDSKKKVDDIVIAHNGSEELAKKISLADITNPLVTVIVKGKDLVVHKEIAAVVYLNGKDGNDSKDGLTKETAVKTFEKAKELAEDLAKSNEKVLVYVTGTVSVTDTATWEFANPDKIIMYRAPGFKDNLLEVTGSGNLTVKNIVIDGNKKNAPAGKSSLVRVNGSKASLTIEKGASLQNNEMTDRSAYPPAAGGGVNVKDGTVTLDGGTITGNTTVWGGGIFGTNAKIYVKSGTISSNHAVRGKDEDASGGGISTWYKSEIHISGGLIENNTSAGNGGGVSVGAPRVPDASQLLTMTGGTINGNTARDSGGGMFVQGGLDGHFATAKVSGGTFTNNTAKGGFFGGGGIYVNGGHNWPGFHSGELYLTNAIVTDNDAGLAGGGYAACPTSNTDIRVKNGAAFYENKAKEGNELHINANVVWHGSSSKPNYEISDSMLGGAPYHWTYDSNNDKRGTEVPLNDLHGKLYGGELNFDNPVKEADAREAQSMATVIIKGNHAGMRGGGIGSNGDVYIGTSEYTKVTVTKKWMDDNDQLKKRPKSIKVAIYRTTKGSNEKPVYIGYGTVKPDSDGNWSITFDKLPRENQKGIAYVYTAKEIFEDENPLDYKTETKGSASGEEGTIEIINTYEKLDIPVKKVWKKDKESNRPKSIAVHLLANGKEIDGHQLTAEEGWEYTFKDLPKYRNGKEITYTVTEDPIANYKTKIEDFTITNTYMPPDEPQKKPKKYWDTVKVKKAWILDNGRKKTTSVSVQLYRNGVKYGSPVTLSKLNNWQYTWKKLSKQKGEKISWSVKEVKVPKGFKEKIKHNGNTVTITNDDIKRPPENHTPRQHNGQNSMQHKKSKTGDPRKPVVVVIVMLAAAAVMVYVIRRRRS